MAAIRSSDNKTELALRRTLHKMGFRYRKYVKGLPGRPDIVFPRERIAVFVDGDFWHARVLREQGHDDWAQRSPVRNTTYWSTKLARNVRRDLEVTSLLEKEGWLVVRFWESDVRRAVADTAAEVGRVVGLRRMQLGEPNGGHPWR